MTCKKSVEESVMKFWFDHGLYIYAENRPSDQYQEDDVAYFENEFYNWLTGYVNDKDGHECKPMEAVARFIAFSCFPDDIFKVFLKKHPDNFNGYYFDTLATQELCRRVSERICGSKERENVCIDLPKDLYNAFRKQIYIDEVVDRRS